MATRQLSSVIRHLRRTAFLHDAREMTDGQLLECFLARRDEAAFEALVRRHGPMVLGVCRRVLRNTHDVEDAFQATFLVLVRKAASLRQRELVGNWLYGTAYRAALETRTTNAARQARERQMWEMPERETLAETDIWQELRPLLDQELNRLPEKYRVPVVLCDLEGRKRKDVARQLGIPEGTLSSRLATARRMLAKRLARHGVMVSGGALALALSQNAATAGVPSSLMVSTVQAARWVAAGSATTAGVISAKVAAVTEGVMKAMFVIQLQRALVLVLAVGILFSGGMVTYRTLAAGQTGAKKQGTPQTADSAETVGEVRRFEGHTDGVHWVALSPDGRLALSGAAQPGEDDPVVRLWDVKTGKELKHFEGHTGKVEAVAFSPDGKRAASCGGDNTIRLWDVEKGQELKRLEGHADNVYSVVFSPDGKRLLSGSQDKTMRLWDVETGQELKRFQGHEHAVRGVALSPDGKKALSAGWDKTARLWDVDNGNEIRRFEGHTEDHVCSVAFSPDGKRAVSCAGDETIRLWDVENGQELRCFNGHTDMYVYVVAFSRDGKRLLSGGEDKTVRLWDVETGKELHCFSGHGERVRGVVFSPDGQYALSGSVDKTLRLWRLPK
jgi:RNA polymerase sigma factor (sigma-70 family)